jgi:hypothetical protein
METRFVVMAEEGFFAMLFTVSAWVMVSGLASLLG